MIITFDIETKGLEATRSAFILGCTCDEKYNTKYFLKPEEMWKYLYTLGERTKQNKQLLTAYAHNTSYDFWGLIPRNNKNFKFYSENPFICEFDDGVSRIIFLDTMNLYRMSLDKAGDMFGYRKIRIQNKEDLTKQPIKEVIEYCKRDVIITMKLIEEMRNMIEEDNIKIKRLYTINQIAIQYMLKSFTKKEREYLVQNKRYGNLIRPKYSKMIHDAYRGGRTECFKVGKFEKVKYIDCNNLYGYSAINMRFPDLRTEKEIKYPLNTMSKNELLDKIGISKCCLINELDEIGLIPIRTTTTSYYPTKGSIIIGTWTNMEIRKAIENGYRIIDIEKSVIYEEAKENPFKEYITELYEKRKPIGKPWEGNNSFRKYFYKQMMNSGFGKLGQTRTDQIIFIDSVEKAEEYLKEGVEIIKGLDLNYMYKKELPEKRQKKYYCPIIPTLINAYARLYMYDIFKKIGVNNIIYTDTDSAVFIGKIPKKIKIGKEIGEFKIEHEDVRMLIWGRKTYMIGYEMKASGIHKGQLKKEDFERGYIKHTQMRTLGNSENIEEIGLFKEEIRDLHEQRDKVLSEKRLNLGKRLYIDKNINNISFFLEKIKRFI